MRKNLKQTLLILITVVASAISVQAKSDKAAVHVPDMVWADGEIYSMVLISNRFNMPPEQSLDILFNFGPSGLMGQRLVSDAAPGSGSYNGGRWAVHVVTFTDAGLIAHDLDNDGYIDMEFTSAEMVHMHMALGHLTVEAVDVYFSCPLVKVGK